MSSLFLKWQIMVYAFVSNWLSFLSVISPMMPWISGAKFQGETLHPSVPVHCQYSSRFITTMEKPILYTSWLLFVEQRLIHTRIGRFCNCLRAPGSLRTLSARKFREWKTTPDARNAQRGGAVPKGESVCFPCAVLCQLTVNCRLSACSYGAAKKNMRASSDRQVAKAFIFCSQVERLWVGGLFPVIHILALEKADV